MKQVKRLALTLILGAIAHRSREMIVFPMFFLGVVCVTGKTQHNGITSIMTFSDVESLDYASIKLSSPHMVLLEV